jgi:hypothetical protein
VITRFAMPYFGCSFRNAAAAQGDRVEVVEVLALDCKFGDNITGRVR